MLRRSLSLLPFALLLSTQAFSYGGNGRRPAADPPIPVDTGNSTQTVSTDGSTVWIDGSFSNVKGQKLLFCDIHAEVKARKGSDTLTVYATVDRRVVKAGRGFNDRFQFDLTEAGSGYRFDKKSQVYQLSCLELDAGENPAQVPSPHEKCDPEFDSCDWSCPAQAQDPDSCAGGW